MEEKDMIIDAENRFSNGQAITGDAASTNIIDLGDIASKVQSRIKKGAARLYVAAKEGFNTLTSLTISLRTAAAYTGTVANGSLSSPTTVLSKTILLADLVDGAVLIDQELPIGLDQYVDLYYDVNGSDPSEGSINAFIVTDSQSNGMA